MQYETVAIPVAKGINVNTPARLLEPMELLEAKNVRIPRGAGAKKRRGHSGQKIRGAKPIPTGWTTPTFTKSSRVEPYYTGDRSIPSTWVIGYGYHTGIARSSPATALETSAYPDGISLDAAQRDEEQLTWDGHRLLSRTSLEIVGGRAAEYNAVLPQLRAEPFAKANIAQGQPDCADNGTIRVAAWITGTTAYYAVFDSSLGTSLVPPTALDVLQARQVRCVPVGPWVHIHVVSGDTNTLYLRSIHEDTPQSVNQRSLGDCTNYFDAWKLSETAWVVAQSQGTQVTVRQLDVDGTVDLSFTPSLGITAVTTVALCVHPTTNLIGLAWRADGNVKACQVNLAAGTIAGTVTLGPVTATARPVAIAPKYVLDENDEGLFNVYWDDWSGTYATLFVSRFAVTSGVVYSASIFHHFVSSQGFRVGDRTFIWAGHRSTYQSTWQLLDESLRPVGRLNYLTANVPLATDFPALASVNWWGEASDKDRCVYHCGLGDRVRVAIEPTTVGANAPAVYSEPYIDFVRLDFLPRLRWAQAGRSTYFAGAQLWAYDGAELTEANFTYAPEDVVVATTTGTLTGSYIYRIDLCYRNAQNEEIRSASFYTASVAPAAQGVLLTIPTVLTRRANSYFLIFRNEDNGSLWYLANSRDPASAQFLSNDQSVREVTYTDTVSDASLISREQHPNQSFDYLDPFAAPASEVIAAGRNRLWLAGGEVPFGQVYPSRLFNPGEVPAFHADLAIQVDRNAEPITAIGFIGLYTIFFRRSHAYIEDGDGPDNIQQGDWSVNGPRLAPASLGAIGQESLAKIDAGLLFQSPAGIRLMTEGGNAIPIGQPMDLIAKDMDISSALVVSADQEVRFYGWDTTLVYNYQYNIWTQWDISAAGAVTNVETGLATLSTPTGSLWLETDGLFTDDLQPYNQRIRFAWLRAGQLMDFQKVRRIGGLGEGTDHSIRVEVFYNEREFAEEWFEWNVPDDSQNQDTFGAGDFGDGNFGDNSSLPGVSFKDSTWPWRRRLLRQKCSVISVAIDDNYTNGEGFTLTALALELKPKKGLQRTPWLGGTYTNTGGSGTTDTGE